MVSARPKVLLLTIDDYSTSPPGPQAARMITLARELSRLCDVTFATTTPVHGDHRGYLKGCQHIELPYRFGREDIRRPWRVTRVKGLYRAVMGLMKDHDALYTDATYYTGLVRAAHRYGKPHIVEVNGILGVELGMKKYIPLVSLLSRAIPVMERSTLASSDALIAVTDQIRDYLVREYGVSRDRITVVPNGVDTDRFSGIDPTDVERVRSEYGLDNGAVAFLSSFRPWHNVSNVLEVFSGVVKDMPGAKLFLIGDGPTRGEAMELARSMGIEDSVVFTGAVPYDKVPVYLSACDVGVHLPYYEAGRRRIIGESPLKLAEYMAAGLPVVMSPVPYASGHLRDSGAGYVCRTPREASEKIVLLLSDDKLRKSMSEKAVSYATRVLSMRAIAKRIYSVIARAEVVE